MIRLITIAALLFSTAAFAQDNSAKQLAAIPSLVVQRNNALDGLAVCSGETATLQAKVVELQKQLDDSKKPKDEPEK